MEKLVVEQLISGPVNDETFPTISPDTKLVNITVRDNICYLTFDSAILTAVNNVTTDVTIYSIVNSLVELSNINKVQISIDGNKEENFGTNTRRPLCLSVICHLSTDHLG